MKMKLLAVACAGSTLIAANAPVLAEGSPHEISANVALTTNYMFRGVSQTGNGPAIQGGFDYSYTPWNIYLGAWGSNVKSAGFGGASMELDLYAGWAPTWDKFGLDLGYLRYQYPTTDNTDNNTDELHIGASYDFGVATPSFTINYSNDWFGTDDAWYYDLSLDVPLPWELSLAAHYGWNDFDNSSGLEDYGDWKIGLSRDFIGLGFDLSYVDNDLHQNQDPNCDNVTFKCSGTLVLTVSKSF